MNVALSLDAGGRGRGWGRHGLSLASAWPGSLRWPLVVDGPQAEGGVGSGVLWLPQPWVLGPWHSSGQEGARLPRGSSARPVWETGGVPALQPPHPASHWLRCPESEPGNGSAVRGWRCGCPDSWGEPQPPTGPCCGGRGAGFVHPSPGLAWIGLVLGGEAEVTAPCSIYCAQALAP